MDAKIKYFGIFAVSAIGIYLLFGIFTGLIENPFFRVGGMIEKTIWDYAFLFIFSLLFGIIVSLLIYNNEIKKAHKKSGAAAICGSASAFLAITCPFCNLLIFSLLGISGSFAIFAPYRLELRIISIALMLIAIYFSFSSIRNIKKEKNAK
ncbi:MAG: hypothetical protein HYW05_02815 [Candidatus Diapherotrites archaeon]|nr:hypothetical protein [Candidatus Diapherotrites archaeon]